VEDDILEQFEIIRGMTVLKFVELVKQDPEKLIRWGLIRRKEPGSKPQEISSQDISYHEITHSRPGCCPECGSSISFEGGCSVCKNCGYSECG